MVVIKVVLSGPERGELVSRFRNLGEDVYRDLAGLAETDMAAIDRSRDHFLVCDIRKRDLGTVTSALQRLIRSHNLMGLVTLQRDD